MDEASAVLATRLGSRVDLEWRCGSLTCGVEDPRIQIDPEVGALHEVRGRLELGPPKTSASVRPVHLPPFLVDLLAEHRERHPKARFVFTGTDGALRRRSNFRRRA